MNKAHCQDLLCLAVICFLGVVCYQRTFSHQFVYDDHNNIEDNRFIRSWRYLPAIFGSRETAGYDGPNLPQYRPLVNVLYQLDYRLHGLEPRGYHLTSLVLHLTCGMLVFALCRTVGMRPAIALVPATLFVAHPANVEAVAWLGGRACLLSVMFLLAALLMFRQHIKTTTGCPASTRTPLLWLLLSLFCFWLALLSKEIAVTFPLLIGVITLLHRDTAGQGRRWAAPIIAAYCSATGIYLLLRVYILPVALHSGEFSHLQRGQLVLSSLAAHVGLGLFPLPLYVDCELPLTGRWALFLTGAGTLTAIGLAAAFWWSWRRSTALALGIAILLTGYALTSNILPLPVTFTQRWLYWPLVGLLLALGAALNILLNRRPSWRIPVLCVGWLVVATYSIRTSQECRIWRDDETLFRTVLARGGQRERDYTNLGLCRHRAGAFDEAIHYYRQALQVSPQYGRAIYLLGCAHGAMGDYDSAIARFQQDLALNPAESASALPLATAYEMKGDVAAAERVLRTAVTSATTPQAALALARLYATRDRLPAAANLLQSLITQSPNNAEAHALLGWVFLQQNQLSAAEQQLRLALKFDPGAALALGTLAELEKRRANDSR